jgi:ribosome maturation factor RimP
MDFCAALNHRLTEALGDEDYSLEVGSVSLTAPFKTRLQYEKHLGHAVEVLTKDGKKLHGQLVSVDEETFAVDVEMMVAVDGKKRKQKEIQTITFRYGDVKHTKYEIKL